jgi:hypothetical protein
MKTVIDAVNELKADLNNTVNGIVEGKGNIILIDDEGVICSVDDFKFLVFELSHAAWIKGASLAEYQAADKEVLKVDNKTVECNGQVYQLGKDYEFRNEGDRDWVKHSLNVVRIMNDLPFAANGFWWEYCRIVDADNLGAITHAPVDLIDGEVYSFNVIVNNQLGITKKGLGYYIKAHDSFLTGPCIYLRKGCMDITHLTPSK